LLLLDVVDVNKV